LKFLIADMLTREKYPSIKPVDIVSAGRNLIMSSSGHAPAGAGCFLPARQISHHEGVLL
jgi:hypothetical protein